MPVVSFALGSSIIFATGVTSAAAVTGIYAAVSAALIKAPTAKALSASQYLTGARKMTEVTIAQDVEHQPLLVGLSYWQTIDALAQGETDGVAQLWSSLRAFEPPPPPAKVDIRDGHCVTLGALGDCMPSGPQEGQEMVIDDRLPIRPGDLAAFVYRRGVAPQAKTYLGKWTGGDHSPIAGDRQIDAVYVFLQEKPPALVLVPEQDMMAAIRVAGIDRWTVDPSRWLDFSEILALVDKIDLPPAPIANYLAAAEAERQAFFRFLIARCNADEQEAFYQRHPQARAMAASSAASMERDA